MNSKMASVATQSVTRVLDMHLSTSKGFLGLAQVLAMLDAAFLLLCMVYVFLNNAMPSGVAAWLPLHYGVQIALMGLLGLLIREYHQAWRVAGERTDPLRAWPVKFMGLLGHFRFLIAWAPSSHKGLLLLCPALLMNFYLLDGFDPYFAIGITPWQIKDAGFFLVQLGLLIPVVVVSASAERMTAGYTEQLLWRYGVVIKAASTPS